MSQFKMRCSVVVALLGATAVAFAEDDLSVGVTADFFSKYVWRGQKVTDDGVFQPGVSVTYKGLTKLYFGI